MRRTKRVIFAFGAPGETGKAIFLTQGSNAVTTTSDDLVRITLMTNIKNQAVVGGVKNLMVSNGYICQEPLRKLAGYLDAANIDLKSFSAQTYKDHFGGHLKPVLDTLQTLKEAGVWLEITNLLIPGLTDDPVETARMCDWLVSRGFADTPVHFSRFHPMFRLSNLKVTPLSTLETARDIAIRAGFRYVYTGNVPGTGTEDTVCPSCRHTIIRRTGFIVKANEMADGACRYCGTAIAGVW